jgi:hypothetical protein
LGVDAEGAMYGGMDLAEAVKLGTAATLAASDHAPRIERRGIKFNAPLDARTPSYSDNSDAAQANIPEMWSFDFWREFLDEMARHASTSIASEWTIHSDNVTSAHCDSAQNNPRCNCNMTLEALLAPTRTAEETRLAARVANKVDCKRMANPGISPSPLTSSPA